MAVFRNPISFYDDPECDALISKFSNKFFDGLQSLVTVDEFSDLLDSLKLPNSISARLPYEHEQLSRSSSGEDAFNIHSLKFGNTLSLIQFLRRLLSIINIVSNQAHP